MVTNSRNLEKITLQQLTQMHISAIKLQSLATRINVTVYWLTIFNKNKHKQLFSNALPDVPNPFVDRCLTNLTFCSFSNWATCLCSWKTSLKTAIAYNKVHNNKKLNYSTQMTCEQHRKSYNVISGSSQGGGRHGLSLQNTTPLREVHYQNSESVGTAAL